MLPWTKARQQRDRALVSLANLEARCRDLAEERERLTAQLRESQRALERVVDNALFSAGAAPIFAPEDARFQPRTAEQQHGDARTATVPLNADQWRRKVEAAASEQAKRDRKAQLVAQLRAEAAARRKEKQDGR